jgi:hypothetical protein
MRGTKDMKYGASSVMGTMVYSKFPTMGEKSMNFSPVADKKGILVVKTSSSFIIAVGCYSGIPYQVGTQNSRFTHF